MALAFDNYWVDVLQVARIGDDGTLRDHPITIEGAIADLVDADSYAIEIETGKLAVSGRAEIHSAVGTECEQVHKDGIVGVINGKRKGARSNHGVDDSLAVATFDEALVGRIDVTVEDARNVVAVIDANKFSTQRVAVTMLEKDLLTRLVARGVEIHGDVLAVESETGKSDSLRRLLT